MQTHFAGKKLRPVHEHVSDLSLICELLTIGKCIGRCYAAQMPLFFNNLSEPTISSHRVLSTTLRTKFVM